MPEKILPSTYEDLEAEMGIRITVFDQLFSDAIRYFDSLLVQDARSTPGVEEHFLDRFRNLLQKESYHPPRLLRETLIKLSYGYYMKHER